jgi:hypothetical protein
MKTGIPILIIAAAASIAGLTACGTPTPVVSVPGTSSATGQQRAQTDAATNLKSFTAPPGAQRISAIPAAASAELGSAPVVAGQIDDVAFWEVSGTPTTLLAWVQAHLPHEYTLRTSGTEGGGTLHPLVATTTAHPATYPASGRYWYDEFSLPASGSLPARVLVVSATYASSSQVVIRVDAQDAWSVTRTAAQRIGDTVTMVVISKVREYGPIMAGPRELVTSPSLVRRIVTLVNGLPSYATGTNASCPARLAPVLRLSFLHGSTVLATATVNAEACDTASLTIGSHPSVLLGDGTTFGNEVEAIGTLNGVNPGGPMQPAS